MKTVEELQTGYFKIVKNDDSTSYQGPEREGRSIRKFSLLKSSGDYHYSNQSQVSSMNPYHLIHQ